MSRHSGSDEGEKAHLLPENEHEGVDELSELGCVRRTGARRCLAVGGGHDYAFLQRVPTLVLAACFL